jgi:hypothetical protein
MTPERAAITWFMTPDEFVAAVEQVVYAAAVNDTIEGLRGGPPGRGPHTRARALQAWYEALEPDDQQMVTEVARDAAHAAVFGFLTVLDGVRVIDDPPHAELRLTAVNPNGGTTVLNRDPSLEDLHDKFNAMVHPPSEDWPPRPTA